jgi:hypothetical protein
MSCDPRLRVIADGRELRPETRGRLHRFRVPASAQCFQFVSRSAVPAEMRDDSADHRRLGVAVARIAVDGVPVSLNDARLSSGWHDAEPGWRWTNGDAVIDLRVSNEIEVELAMTGLYWLPGAAATDPDPNPRYLILRIDAGN